jgi:DUF4097 and DUF4098 domain-containing protein YvlB
MKIRHALLLAALALPGAACHVHTSDNVVLGLRRYTHPRTVEFAPSDAEVRRLRLHSDLGDVWINGGAEENSVSVRLHERVPGVATVALVDGELVVEASERDAVTGAVVVNLACDVGALRVRCGSGDVFVENLAVLDDLELETGSGDVRVDDLRRARRLVVDTGSGDVRLDGVQAEDVLLETGAGSLELTRVDATRARLDSGLGDIEVADSRILELEADTGLGDIRVRSSEVGSGRYDTGLGSIEAD